MTFYGFDKHEAVLKTANLEGKLDFVLRAWYGGPLRRPVNPAY